MSTEIDVWRYSDNGNSTLGLVMYNSTFECYSLEDEGREIKVQGETRIPQGSYELGIRRVLSGLTKKYRSKHDWFKYHLHVKDVPGFENIYIHVGNTDRHTEGCLLLGNQPNNNKIKAGFLGDSGTAYKAFYQKIYKDASEGNARIHYHDESFF